MLLMYFLKAAVELRIDTFWEHGECRYGRGSRVARDGDVTAILAVWPAGDHRAPSTVERLSSEFALKDRLDRAWALQPREFLRERGRAVLVLEDRGGMPLARRLGSPMTPARFLAMAIPITVAVRRMHDQGLVHKDINPAHIFIDDAGMVTLTGLGLAAAAQVTRPPDAGDSIVGSLAYMAPEQTGCMNRPVDARSDLYSLGVTFYEMLTGILPFNARSIGDWVHCHLARSPLPVVERAGAHVGVLSAIVMKLLAKSGDDRYQTAAGLEADLRLCVANLEAHGAPGDFIPGERDTPAAIRIPARLFGRGAQLGRLVAAFDAVAESGRSGVVLISGEPGVGKSALMHELQRTVVARHGAFIAAAPRPDGDALPFAALARAFGARIRLLLCKSQPERAQWRATVSEALGPYARIVTDWIPELKLLLGSPHPPLGQADRQSEAQYRMAFRRLVGAFARPGCPLVLCVDDFQWIDRATRDLLEMIVADPDCGNLLLVLACRKGAANLSALGEGRLAAAQVCVLDLASLEQDELAALVTETLHCAPGEADALSGLIWERTGGNPFFVTQLLSELADEGLLAFDAAARRWTWRLADIQAKGYKDNVVDLVLTRLGRLPARTQRALQQLACIGNDTPLARMRLVADVAHAVESDLEAAIDAGLIVHGTAGYRFRHDRIREAAYRLIPAALRSRAHLDIGQRLMQILPPDDRAGDEPQEESKQDEAGLHLVVGQLNKAVALIHEPDAQVRLADLNLRAALRAKAVCAYATALEYLDVAMAMLSRASARHPERRHAVSLCIAECEFLSGMPGPAEQRIMALLDASASLAAQAAVTKLHLDLLLTGGRREEAVQAGLDFLRRAGVAWTARPADAAVAQEHERLGRQLARRPIEQLTGLPRMTQPDACGVMKVLAALMQPAWYSNQNLRSLVILRMVNLSLMHGHSEESCMAYAWLGMLLSGSDARQAARFGQLGVGLAAGGGSDRVRARVSQIVGGNVFHWTQPLRTARATVRRALEQTESIGDTTFASYIRSNLITHALAIGDPLQAVQGSIEAGWGQVWGPRFELVVDRVMPSLQLVRTLRGQTRVFGSFDDERFDEAAFERRAADGADLPIAACWYWIRKLQARYLAGSHAEAVDAAQRARQLLWTSPSYFEIAEFEFFAALATAASRGIDDAGDPARRTRDLAGHVRRLRAWADDAPSTFHCRAELVAAELARLEGRDADAMRAYEAAIASARDNDFVHVQAIANELAGRFYLSHRMDRVARTYLQDARSGYLHWGADAKVWQLDASYPEIGGAETRLPGAASGINAGRASVPLLDSAAVMAVSQAIAGEIRPERIIRSLMEMAIERAGASRGVLVVLSGPEARIAAIATTARHSIDIELRDDALDPQSLPVSLIYDVLRSREHCVIEDASAGRPFAADPYLMHSGARSVLCLPLLSQASLTGVLYLENRFAPGIFVPARTALLTLLGGQAAIALENNRLYEEARQTDESLHRARAELAHLGRVMTLNALTASIAHEISQPLAALTINANAALRWLERPQPDLQEAKEALREIGSQTKRAHGVITSMRAMLRKTEAVTLPVDVGATVRETIALLAGEIGKHGVSVSVELAADLHVAGDKIQLQQVLINLIVNGIEAMKGVVAHSRDLHVRAGIEQGNVVIDVKDAGVGLPMTDPEPLFDAFYSTKPEGMGMGLSICRTIVEAHGGDIRAVANLAAGSPGGATFRVTLPASEPARSDAR